MDILVIDDEPAIREAALQLIEDAGHYAEAAANSEVALETLRDSQFELVLLDLNLGHESGLELLGRILEKNPRTPVVVVTAQSSIESAVEAMRLGALDYIEKPFGEQHLALLLQRIRHHRQLTDKVETLQQEISNHQLEPSFSSTSQEMESALDILFRSADTDASVLVLGESGTGKSIVAREVHSRSGRANQPFVTINCPALSKELLESELFGHVKGSFTGAVRDAWGKVKAADQGTLFLDEIGELPKEIQPKLLRLLQDREYERVGESTVRQADVRVIAATNRNLEQAVADGEFREDLFFRLNVIAVELPPLRNRPQDVLDFAASYLEFFSNQYRRSVKTISQAAESAMLAYEWPGNLRELRNVVERAVILCRTEAITPEDLPAALQGVEGDAPSIRVGQRCSLEAIENAHIKAIIERTETMAEASEILGIDSATLYRKRKKMDAQEKQAS